MNFQPIAQDDSRHKLVARQIERSIRDDILKPGDQLPNETELARQFGVSRTVIREAVMSLRQAQLLDVRHGVGTFVSVPQAEHTYEQITQLLQWHKTSIWEVHEVRSILEPQLAAIAAERISDEQLCDLAAIFDEMQTQADNAEKFIELDLAFHNAITAATQNATFSLILSPVMNIMVDNRKIGASAPGAIAETLTDHKEVLQAIETRDPGRARTAMTRHLEHVRDNIRTTERSILHNDDGTRGVLED